MATAKKTTNKAAANKATTTKKTVERKPATVKKAAPAKKQEQQPVEEKPKMSWKKKLAIVGAAVTAVVGGIALHGRSKYNEGAADQAAIDIDKFSNQPVDVHVNLITDQQMAFDEPVADVETVDEDQIEEI